MGRDELNLDLERRRAILELIQAYPGLHLSGIARQLGWSPMLTEYHLRVLEKHEIISSIEEDHYRRYYAKVEREGLRVDALGASEKRVLGLLRHPVRLHLVTFLAAMGSGRNKEMAHSLGLSRPATSYQLGKLVRAGVAAKDEADVYHLVDAPLITRLLLAYKPPMDLVEEFRDLWDRLGASLGPAAAPAQPPAPQPPETAPPEPEPAPVVEGVPVEPQPPPAEGSPERGKGSP